MDAKNEVRKQFGKTADNYLTSPVLTNQTDLAHLVELVEPVEHERLLDVGTATGHTAITFAPHVRDVVGLDITPEMLVKARLAAAEKGIQNVEFVEGDAEALPFPDQAFDIVTCRIVAHHIPDVRKAVQEMARVLTPGGRILVVDNYAPEDENLDTFINSVEKMRDPSHVREYKLTEWARFFQSVGIDLSVTETRTKARAFDWWVGVSKTPAPVVEELRDMLSHASEAAQRTFLIETAPQLTFSLLQAVMLGLKR